MEEGQKMTSRQRLHSLVEETKTAYDQIESELQEIALQLKRSRSEVERLAQQDAQIASRVRQIESNLESHPREEIKEAYAAAQDSQMRLFTMRTQMERLQSRQEALEAEAKQLRRFLQVIQEIEDPSSISSREGTIARVIEAQENERRRLARQMHDGPAQSLTNLILQAEICERLFDLDPEQACVELENLRQAVNATFQDTRRFIFGLRPMMLDDLGLVPTLRSYVRDLQQESGLSIDLDLTGEERRLAPHLGATIFRAVQELLDNVERHAHATHVNVSLNFGGERVVVTVEDDGSGFEVEKTLIAVKERKALGLATIQERMELLGGEMEIDSSVGQGTRVRLEAAAG